MNNKSKELINKKFNIKDNKAKGTRLEPDTRPDTRLEPDTRPDTRPGTRPCTRLEPDTKKMNSNIHDFTLVDIDIDSIQDLHIEDKNSIKNNKNKPIKNDIVYYADNLPKQITNSHTSKNKTLHICLYKIMKDYLKPFVMFFLYKNGTNKLDFVELNKSEKIVEDALKKMRKICNNDNIEFKGFIENDTSIHVVLYINNDTNTYNSLWRWSLSSEIVNYKKVFECSIQERVIDFFLDNVELLFVCDKKNNPYECPSVGYYGANANDKSIASIFVLGKQREVEIDNPLGHFYYFENYEEATKGKKTGLVRFALFLGKVKIFSTAKEDKMWYDEHDSIIYKKHSSNLITVVKTYEQQIPLEYYYL